MKEPPEEEDAINQFNSSCHFDGERYEVGLGRRIVHLLLTIMDKNIKHLSPLKEDWQRILRRRECIVMQWANTSKMAMLGR